MRRKLFDLILSLNFIIHLKTNQLRSRVWQEKYVECMDHSVCVNMWYLPVCEKWWHPGIFMYEVLHRCFSCIWFVIDVVATQDT